MYTRFKAQLHFLSMILFLFTMMSNATASDQNHNAIHNGADQQQWICDYTTGHNSVLYIRCEELASLYNDPLIMEGDYFDDSTKLIPVWRRPSSHDGAVMLVKAVICDQKSECSVEFKSLFDSRRIVRR
ncbi:MAG: hypothetical protein ABW139_14170 [Candidatus Thiodiazotropha sp. DIVDIV]